MSATGWESVWQDGKTLVDSSRYMLENQIGCDITFEVGEKRETVRTHKFILISRSPVFQAMFCGPLAETQSAIPIPDIEPDVFEVLLRYMYYDAVPSDVGYALNVLYAAKKYGVNHLVKVCRDLVFQEINTNNACRLLKQLDLLDEPSLYEYCFSFILKNGESCLKSASVVELSIDQVRVIVESDDLVVEELTVWNSLIRWAHALCGETGESATQIGVRDLLGDVIYSVRFKGITADEFAENISTSDILSMEETISVFQFYHKVGHTITNFSMKPGRTPARYLKCYRFKSIRPAPTRGTIRCLTNFNVSAPIRLCGVILYKSVRSEENYAICGQLGSITTGADIEPWKINLTVNSKPDGDQTLDVLFDEPMVLLDNTNYSLSLDVKGQQDYSGVQENKSFEEGNVKFNFMVNIFEFGMGSQTGHQTARPWERVHGFIFQTI